MPVPRWRVCGAEGPRSRELLARAGPWLDPAQVCPVCFEPCAGSFRVVLGPCAHAQLCRLCAAQVDECPLCRRAIRHVLVVRQSA